MKQMTGKALLLLSMMLLLLPDAGIPVSYAMNLDQQNGIKANKIGFTAAHVANNRIYGYVYEDKNGNRVQDIGEPFMSGVVVELLNSTGVVTKSMTGSTGLYEFTSLVRGSYTVREKLTPDYIATTPLGGTFNLTVDGGANRQVDFGNQKIIVLHPGINVTKTADKTYAHIGDAIKYTYTVTNTGDCPLSLSVVDDKISTLSFNGGDTNSDKKLDTNETWVYSATMKAPDIDITNTVTVTGTDAKNTKVTDSSQYTVYILKPGIDVKKSADKNIVILGETIKYSYIVTNTGNCPLSVSIADDKISSLTLFNGDINRNKYLDTTEVWTYTASMNAPDTDITNIATVIGTDYIGGKVTDTDSVTVDITHPKIEITLTGPSSANANSTITSTISVTNKGDVLLKSVKVTDPLFGSTWEKNIGDLAASANYTFTQGYTLKSTDPDPLTNTATVTGIDGLNNTIKATAVSTVDIISSGGGSGGGGSGGGSTGGGGYSTPAPEPAIVPVPTYVPTPVLGTITKPAVPQKPKPKPIYKLEIVKTVDKKSIKASGLLTYTIVVNNTGNAFQKNVVISDSLPVGTDYVKNSATKGVSITNKGRTFNWIYKNLGPGKKITVVLKVKVKVNAKADIKNISATKSKEVPKAIASQTITKLVYAKPVRNRTTSPNKNEQTKLVYYKVLPYKF